jgi:hypothetical protein
MSNAYDDFVIEILQSYDAIVPRRHRWTHSIAGQYMKHHIAADFRLFIEACNYTLPEHRLYVKNFFDNTFHFRPYNMMITSKSFFDEYMSALFNVLEFMEEAKPYSADPYQQRRPAFIAERFMNLYLSLKQTKFYEMPVAILDKKAD